MTEAIVTITAARVDIADGRAVAEISLVEVGGGSQVVTVDGTPEERVHPRSRVFHVRLLSPDRMFPDELRETMTFDDAIELGVKYAQKVAENVERLTAIAADLKV